VLYDGTQNYHAVHQRAVDDIGALLEALAG
jgi:hypothetical protein